MDGGSQWGHVWVGSSGVGGVQSPRGTSDATDGWEAIRVRHQGHQCGGGGLCKLLDGARSARDCGWVCGADGGIKEGLPQRGKGGIRREGGERRERLVKQGWCREGDGGVAHEVAGGKSTRRKGYGCHSRGRGIAAGEGAYKGVERDAVLMGGNSRGEACLQGVGGNDSVVMGGLGVIGIIDGCGLAGGDEMVGVGEA